ncbi:hypothetical protein QYF36_020278 [Acer negundo]|nr:hypothetical protein QYF36_020278 [Acer negundo]
MRRVFRPSRVPFLYHSYVSSFITDRICVPTPVSLFSKGQPLKNRVPFLIKNMSTSIEKPENEVQNIELLSSVQDLYGGVMVEIKEPMDSKLFASMLGTSLSHWRQQGKRGVWIKLPIEFSNLVEPTVKEGFRYHHAESDYLMLVKWIPETSDTLPVNASHRVGIGAFVMNDKGEVLVVQERNGRFKGTNLWKLPTGTVDKGEDIWTAAIREVKEETGINTEFVEVLAFRQSHQSFFRKSDLFFVCMLRPCCFEIQKQDSEIEAAQWMRVEDYAAQPFNQKNEIFKNIAGICLTKSKKDYTGFSTMSSTTSSGKRTYMYFNKRDFQPLSLHKDAHEVSNDDKPVEEVQVDSSTIGKVSSGFEKTSLKASNILSSPDC